MEVFWLSNLQVPVIVRLFLEIHRWPRSLSSLVGASTPRYYFTVLNLDRNPTNNAAVTGFSSASIATGLLGHNAALCAIALKDKPGYAAFSSLAALPLCAAFAWAGVPALTAPFVLATWLASAVAPNTAANATSSSSN